jgi:hypothetical protein
MRVRGCDRLAAADLKRIHSVGYLSTTRFRRWLRRGVVGPIAPLAKRSPVDRHDLTAHHGYARTQPATGVFTRIFDSLTASSEMATLRSV